MATCPTSLYKRVSAVKRAASFSHTSSPALAARAAEIEVRQGRCDAGRKLLRMALKAIRRDRKEKRAFGGGRRRRRRRS